MAEWVYTRAKKYPDLIGTKSGVQVKIAGWDITLNTILGWVYNKQTDTWIIESWNLITGVGQKFNPESDLIIKERSAEVYYRFYINTSDINSAELTDARVVLSRSPQDVALADTKWDQRPEQWISGILKTTLSKQ